MNLFRVRLEGRQYPICVEPGCLPRIHAVFAEKSKIRSVFIVTDTNVARLYGNAVADSLRRAGHRVGMRVVPSGERSKSWRTADRLFTDLLKFRLPREGTILALGGGVVGDLAGFVASTYLRGVPWIQVPTTLLAQVDSSVGGKVAINHPLGKNMIGQFHQPEGVWIDPRVLRTLSLRDRWSGMAEVIKTALIADRNLFAVLEKRLDDLIHLRDDALVSRVVSRCCRLKASVVEKDEREKDLRRILNFGHSIGHALEAAGRFRRFTHGEAVAAGMRWAVWFSRERGLLSDADSSRANRLLHRVPDPRGLAAVRVGDLVRNLALDKKQTADGLFFVFLRGIGDPLVRRVRMDADTVIRGWPHVRN